MTKKPGHQGHRPATPPMVQKAAPPPAPMPPPAPIAEAAPPKPEPQLEPQPEPPALPTLAAGEFYGTMTILRSDGMVDAIDYSTRLASKEDVEEELGGEFERVPALTKFEGKPCAAFALRLNVDARDTRPFNQAATKALQVVNPDTNDVLAGHIVILTGLPRFVASV